MKALLTLIVGFLLGIVCLYSIGFRKEGIEGKRTAWAARGVPLDIDNTKYDITAEGYVAETRSYGVIEYRNCQIVGPMRSSWRKNVEGGGGQYYDDLGQPNGDQWISIKPADQRPLFIRSSAIKRLQPTQ